MNEQIKLNRNILKVVLRKELSDKAKIDFLSNFAQAFCAHCILNPLLLNKHTGNCGVPGNIVKGVQFFTENQKMMYGMDSGIVNPTNIDYTPGDLIEIFAECNKS